MYAFQTWETPRRFVVVKKLTPNPDYDPDRVPVDMFGEPAIPPFLEEYTFYVTNFSPEQLDAEGVWHFHNERETVENRIKESRLGFALDSCPVTISSAMLFTLSSCFWLTICSTR